MDDLDACQGVNVLVGFASLKNLHYLVCNEKISFYESAKIHKALVFKVDKSSDYKSEDLAKRYITKS